MADLETVAVRMDTVVQAVLQVVRKHTALAVLRVVRTALAGLQAVADRRRPGLLCRTYNIQPNWPRQSGRSDSQRQGRTE